MAYHRKVIGQKPEGLGCCDVSCVVCVWCGLECGVVSSVVWCGVLCSFLPVGVIAAQAGGGKGIVRECRERLLGVGPPVALAIEILLRLAHCKFPGKVATSLIIIDAAVQALQFDLAEACSGSPVLNGGWRRKDSHCVARSWRLVIASIRARLAPTASGSACIPRFHRACRLGGCRGALVPVVGGHPWWVRVYNTDVLAVRSRAMPTCRGLHSPRQVACSTPWPGLPELRSAETAGSAHCTSCCLCDNGGNGHEWHRKEHGCQVGAGGAGPCLSVVALKCLAQL